MHALVLLIINQHRKFKMLRFTDSKDIIGGQNLKGGHVTLTTPMDNARCRSLRDMPTVLHVRALTI